VARDFQSARARQCEHPLRRLAPANFLNGLRIFKRAIWHKQIYVAHVFDHAFRSIPYIQQQKNAVRVLTNPLHLRAFELRASCAVQQS
jgi:hypothetical protein